MNLLTNQLKLNNDVYIYNTNVFIGSSSRSSLLDSFIIQDSDARHRTISQKTLEPSGFSQRADGYSFFSGERNE